MREETVFNRDGTLDLDLFLDQFVGEHNENVDGFFEQWGSSTSTAATTSSAKKTKEPREPREPKEPKEPREPKRARNAIGSAAAATIRAAGGAGKSIMKTVRAADGTLLSVKKKLRLRAPDEPLYVRVPTPLPSSWAGAIRSLHALDRDDRLGTTREPRVDQASRLTCHARVNIAADILALDYAALQREHGDFLVVMINVPWHLDKPEWAGFNTDVSKCSTRRITAEQFVALDYFAAVPCGFVFVWVEKEYLAEIVLHMERRQYLYVENFVWVKLQPNGEPYRGPSPLFAKTKASMLLFRKGDIAMRHQRSSDTVLELIPPAYDDFDTKPESAFEAIEALVPTSDYARPRFLELWAPLGRPARPGWVSVYDTVGRVDAATRFVADANAQGARQHEAFAKWRAAQPQRAPREHVREAMAEDDENGEEVVDDDLADDADDDADDDGGDVENDEEEEPQPNNVVVISSSSGSGSGGDGNKVSSAANNQLTEDELLARALAEVDDYF